MSERIKKIIKGDIQEAATLITEIENDGIEPGIHIPLQLIADKLVTRHVTILHVVFKAHTEVVARICSPPVLDASSDRIEIA